MRLRLLSAAAVGKTFCFSHIGPSMSFLSVVDLPSAHQCRKHRPSEETLLQTFYRDPVEKQVSSKLTMMTGIPRRSASAGNSLAGRTILLSKEPVPLVWRVPNVLTLSKAVRPAAVAQSAANYNEEVRVLDCGSCFLHGTIRHRLLEHHGLRTEWRTALRTCRNISMATG